MAKTILLILLSIFQLQAQNQNNHWFMGTYLGMRFTNNTMQPIPVNTSKMYAPYGSASYSDPITGALKFYTNGAYVYNRLHHQMPNGFYINNETFAAHCVIIPHPGNIHLYYIITGSTSSSTLYYALVDMRLNNGLGDITEKAKVLHNNADLHFTVVKQYYDAGYWLITHESGSNKFLTYAITQEGLSITPVISVAGKSNKSNGQYTYGKMVSNSSGNEFIFTSTLDDAFNSAYAEIFSFDKQCAKIIFKKSLLPHPMQGIEIIAYPAYSQNEKVIYISWLLNTGNSLLIQYNLNDDEPNSTYVIVSGGNYNSGDMQLAPDGKIYVSSSENGMVTSKVNVINNPNQIGIGCGFVEYQTNLGPVDQPLGTYYTEHFPEFILDNSRYSTGLRKPELRILSACFNEPVSYGLNEPLTADSFRWEFGDGKTSSLINPIHIYDSVKSYVVTFTWYLCAIKFFITDTITMYQKPKIHIGNDTTLCAGVIFTLTGPSEAYKYEWNTGDTTRQIQVNKPNLYSLKASIGNCVVFDDIKIDFYPSLYTELGELYFICDKDKELIKLDPGEGYMQYKWTPTGDTTQWIIVGDLGDYFVVVKDFRGCSGEDGTTVQKRCPVTIYFPNAFTPNNDGINDTYQPKGSDVESFHIQIYNRWGEMVFESADLNYHWDGKVNKSNAPDGVYYFIAEYSGYIQKRLKKFDTKGNFTLLH